MNINFYYFKKYNNYFIYHRNWKRFQSNLKEIEKLPPPISLNINRRVVVTGLGLVTPLGTGVKKNWDAIISGESGIRKLEEYIKDIPYWKNINISSIPSKVVANVIKGEKPGEFNINEWIPKKDSISSISPFIQYAICASVQALKDANWFPKNEYEQKRTGVVIGSSMGSLEDITETNSIFLSKGYNKISPWFIPRTLINLASGQISILFGFRGPNHSCSTACATGGHSIGDAFRMIRWGDADVIIAGGTEACITPLSIAGFCRLKALSTHFNDTPQLASRPFDTLRDGFVIGEGAGILVLEEYQHALQRGANIYAEMRSYGLSGDGYHITAPSMDGDGAYRCMKSAIEQSGLELYHIDYINAHATSTPLGDKIENKSIKDLFGKHAYQLCISSTKGATGHLLGAAGAVEAIFSILALYHNIIPPTLNLNSVDNPIEFDLNYVPNKPQYFGKKYNQKELRAVLTNSFGFGGTNTSLIFTKIY